VFETVGRKVNKVEGEEDLLGRAIEEGMSRLVARCRDGIGRKTKLQWQGTKRDRIAEEVEAACPDLEEIGRVEADMVLSAIEGYWLVGW
jgi:hypothetical protein